MAWYSDEQYEMIKDSREKKSIAASAFKQKTHCGKGGRVKFPSDYMTRKELKAMNGECKSYRMNDPISWSEFLEWPNEHKTTYIKRIRERFGASDKCIAEMFDVACNMFLMYVRELGLETKIDCDEGWEQQKFYAWRSGAKTELVEENEAEKYPWYPVTWSEFKKFSNDDKTNYIQWLRDTYNVPDRELAEMFDVGFNTVYRHFKALDICKGMGSGNKIKGWDKDGFMAWRGMTPEEVETKEVETEPVDTDKLFQEHVARVDQICEEFEKPTGVALEEVVSKERAEAIEKLCQEAMDVINHGTDIPNTCDIAPECMQKRIRDAGPIAFAGNRVPVIPKSCSMSFENNDVDDILTVLRTMLYGVRVNMSVTWEISE